jgi:hypothetical protein
MFRRKKLGLINQPFKTEKQVHLNAKVTNQKLTGTNFLENTKYAFAVVRKTPYIDNIALKETISKIEKHTIKK